ncbi:phosphonate ABC transporter ATP-binding protein [Rhodoferax sp.]|uniref:phosphonate ABC transporter ATP-binding protein n=1 Tax=Rhodoferax sp. TaxID=50421 RepID=UPI00276E911C|nr:ATP-binding cassette domain-containing protein [Rhodoferax sp.]
MQLELTSLSARHLTAKPGAKAALHTVTLLVASGEQVAIIGPSGAGKTTLLNVVACAQRPNAGTLILGGLAPWSLSADALRALRAALFLAPQVPPLPPRQRVVTAVLAGRLPHQGLWASVRSLFYPHDIALAERALARFGVADKLFERVDRLSGGERQRVALARLVASEAQLFLVDEPLSALDPTRGQQAMEALTEVAHERQATLVTSLHHVEIALHHFPRIVGLRDGQIAFDLPTARVTPDVLRALYAQHLHELTGPAATSPLDSPDVVVPVVMHCR